MMTGEKSRKREVIFIPCREKFARHVKSVVNICHGKDGKKTGIPRYPPTDEKPEPDKLIAMPIRTKKEERTPPQGIYLDINPLLFRVST